MRSSSEDKYAFIVGGGDLPFRIIKEAEKQKLDFIVVGIRGFSPKALVNSYDNFWFYIGEIADFINKLKYNNVNKIVLVGYMQRPSLFSIRLDSLGRELIKELYNSTGDNSLLSKVIEIIESNGFKIIAAQEIDPSILAEEGLLSLTTIAEEYKEDIDKGFLLAKQLSVFDIGQSIIFQQNMVIAVEAVEGTAAMIKRSKDILKKAGRKGILIKVKKQHQEERVDLPTIGDKTIKQVKDAGLAGIIVEAQSTIILNKNEVVRLANKYGIFIMVKKA